MADPVPHPSRRMPPGARPGTSQVRPPQAAPPTQPQRPAGPQQGGGIGSGTGLQGDIDTLLGGIEAGGGANNAIGLDTPADWQRHEPFSLSRQMVGGLPDSMGLPGRGPAEPYFEGSEVTLLRGMPAEQRARLQDILVATGLTSSVIPGEMDDGTLTGFSRLLGIANRRGERWQSTIQRLTRGLDSGEIPNQAADEGPPPFRFVEREYLPPDPAELRNSIRELAEKIVPDIELSDDELDYLRTQFEGMGREQFESEEHQRRHDAEAEFEASADVPPGTDEVIATSEAVAPVSAADRFREFFEDRYESNIGRREDQEEEVGRRKVTDANLGSLLQIATGGR